MENVELPPYSAWDHRASEAQAREWILAALSGSSQAFPAISRLGDSRTAPAIRDFLARPDVLAKPPLLAALINSLGLEWRPERRPALVGTA